MLSPAAQMIRAKQPKGLLSYELGKKAEDRSLWNLLRNPSFPPLATPVLSLAIKAA
jgi:hypothetical protein